MKELNKKIKMIGKIPILENTAVSTSSPAPPDDKDKRLADERSATALKLQRKQRLEAIVQKRKTNFSYLKVIFFRKYVRTVSNSL